MSRSDLCRSHEHRISRRRWLGATAAALGLGGGAMPRALADGLKAARKQVIFLWLDGGLSGPFHK
jgi:uncharacterized protein (DUF1501 family)